MTDTHAPEPQTLVKEIMLEPIALLAAVFVALPLAVRLITAASDWAERRIQRSRYKDSFRHVS